MTSEMSSSITCLSSNSTYAYLLKYDINGIHMGLSKLCLQAIEKFDNF